MITDDMIEAARECLPAEIAGNIHSALEAAYPLIRAQVLEEAAAVCDRRFMGDNVREDLEAKRCAKAIRGMVNLHGASPVVSV